MLALPCGQTRVPARPGPRRAWSYAASNIQPGSTAAGIEPCIERASPEGSDPEDTGVCCPVVHGTGDGAEPAHDSHAHETHQLDGIRETATASAQPGFERDFRTSRRHDMAPPLERVHRRPCRSQWFKTHARKKDGKGLAGRRQRLIATLTTRRICPASLKKH